MEEVSSFEQVKEIVRNNTVIVDSGKSALVENSKIIFKGNNNILFIEDGVCIKKSTIIFQGDNAVVYLSKNKHTYLMRITVYHESVVYIGEDCYINGAMTLIASERQNIIRGQEGLFSFGIFVRTADPHLAYDCETKERINASKSVFIGDHVWIGQDALILKGTWIGSGSIIGARTLLAGKSVFSNVSVGGNPAKIIRKNVFFSSECTHSWTKETTENYAFMDSDRYIYSAEEEGAAYLEQIDAELKVSVTANQKLEKIQKLLVDNKEKNRFVIEEVKKKKLWAFWK